jgi:ribosomal protein S18 acetylase RimI-like enzyme
MNRPFRVERLAAHDRSRFNSGVTSLDNYIRERAGQYERRQMAACFVAIDTENEEVAGYFTLSATAISADDLPADIVKRLPRYPEIPAVLMGRLAVDTRYRGRKLGFSLIANAAKRAMAGDVATFALVVDAIDDNAARFYRHAGFQPFARRPMSLFAPLAMLRKASDE